MRRVQRGVRATANVTERPWDRIDMNLTFTVRAHAKMGDTAPPAAKFRKIAVFCGASSGSNPAYIQAATQLGEELAARGIGLVYGVRRRGHWRQRRRRSTGGLCFALLGLEWRVVHMSVFITRR